MTTIDRPLNVFLSHSSNDKSVVRELYQQLNAKPWLNPWLDEENLYPGQDWNLEIEKSIKNTDVIIVCLSESSITKEGYFQKEIKAALYYSEYKPEGTIFIIPTRLEDCNPPTRFHKWQYMDYFGDNRDRALERLLISLEQRAVSLNLKPDVSIEKEKAYVPKEKSRISIYQRVVSVLSKETKRFIAPLYQKIPDTMQVGLMGPLGSGKTTYLAMLQHTNCHNWLISPYGQETQQICMGYDNFYQKNKEFMPATAPDEITDLSFQFEKTNKFLGKKKFQVNISDVSGEYYEYPEMHPEANKLYRNQAFIWLIDPVRLSSSDEELRTYRRMIYSWLTSIYYAQEDSGVIKSRIALCLTKMDLPKHSPFINIPKEYSLALLGQHVEIFMMQYCDPKNIGFFATSSLGFSDGIMMSNVDTNTPHKIISAPEPINLCEPFEWLVNGF